MFKNQKLVNKLIIAASDTITQTTIITMNLQLLIISAIVLIFSYKSSAKEYKCVDGVLSGPKYDTHDKLLAHPKEYPHAALVGYGDKKDDKWLCTGTLISDQYVLTAAYCGRAPQVGEAKRVRLGELDYKNSSFDSKPVDYTVEKVIAHPDYRLPLRYNDLALLKLDRKVDFNDYVKPACLQTEKSLANEKLASPGWGRLEYAGEQSTHMLSTDLKLVDFESCADSYKQTSNRTLPQGIMDDKHICSKAYPGQHTCGVIGGAPLQIRVDVPDSDKYYYSVVGVVSFGKPCIADVDVVVSTRVSTYVPWINSVISEA